MARLKRSDLSEEFSDIVKQEVKNHNDSILASNISINSMKEEVKKATIIFDRKIRTIQDSVFDQSLSIESLKKASECVLLQARKEINESSKLQCNQLLAIKTAIDNRESYFVRVEGFNQFKIKFDEAIAKVEFMFHSLKDAVRQDYVNIGSIHDQKVEEIRTHLNKRVECESLERKLMERSLDTFAVHSDGVKGEIENLKKRLFVIEKNIENLHTRMDRLKAGVS